MCWYFLKMFCFHILDAGPLVYVSLDHFEKHAFQLSMWWNRFPNLLVQYSMFWAPLSLSVWMILHAFFSSCAIENDCKIFLFNIPCVGPTLLGPLVPVSIHILLSYNFMLYKQFHFCLLLFFHHKCFCSIFHVLSPLVPVSLNDFGKLFSVVLGQQNLFVQHSICWAPLSLSVATSCFLIILCCTKSSTFLSFFFVTTNVFVQYSMCCQHCWAPLSLSVATSWFRII